MPESDITRQVDSGTDEAELPVNELAAVHQARRRDIDGLRGIAVVTVVLYHFFPDLVPGGFLGVDVFFVISGFVITNLLLRQQPMKIKELGLFWGHRIRRLFPALIVVIAVSIFLGWFILWPIQFQGLSESATWSAAMLGNIYAFDQTGYFASEPTWNPLLNLWSLGVEEQFYFVWPVLLGAIWMLFRGRRIALVSVVALLTLISWLAGYTYGHGEIGGEAEAAVFYLPWFRAWELLVGALVAFALMSPRFISFTESKRQSLTLVLPYLASLIVMVTALFWTYESQRPSEYAIIIVLVTGVVIALGSAVGRVNTLSGNALFLAMGKVSYPLYLWHWPILALGLSAGFAESTGSKWVLIGISLVLAGITRYLIENPIQRRQVTPSLIITLAIAMGVTVLMGAAFSTSAVSRLNDQDLVTELANFSYDTDPDYDVGGCFIEGGDGQVPEDLETCIPNGYSPGSVLVWGDSHAASMMAGIRKSLQGRSVFQLTMAGCYPSLPEDAEPASCNTSNELALKSIADGQFGAVILAAWWRDAYEVSDLVKVIGKIKRTSEAKIVVVGPLPRWSPALNRVWTPDEISQFERLPLYTKTGLLDSPKEFDIAFKEALKGVNVEYASPLDFLCNENGCRVTVDGTPGALTAWDYGHLTRLGSELLGPAITAKLK